MNKLSTSLRDNKQSEESKKKPEFLESEENKLDLLEKGLKWKSKEESSFTPKDKEKSRKDLLKNQTEESLVLELKKERSKEELSSVKEKSSSEEKSLSEN